MAARFARRQRGGGGGGGGGSEALGRGVGGVVPPHPPYWRCLLSSKSIIQYLTNKSIYLRN